MTSCMRMLANDRIYEKQRTLASDKLYEDVS